MGEYLDFSFGQSNIILTAPHGGNMKPEGIPHRKYGTFVRDTDSQEVARAMLRYFSVEPSYVIAEIHRDRVDLNREIAEAAQGNPEAESIWKLWHETIDDYCSRVMRPLYIDLHTHNNSDEFQLGFALSKQAYLELEHRPDDPRYNHIFGENSIHDNIEDLGYKVYNPKFGEVYFNGGYDIERHGKNGVDALQIEMPVDVIRDHIATVAQMLVEAIEGYNKTRS